MARINNSPAPAKAGTDNLPNVFVIGAPKSGTTTLHGILDQHPQIYMCSPKEPRFFSRDSEYEKGLDWYIDTYFRNAGSYRIRGEATPTYLYMNQKTIPRIQKCLNGQTAKFIAVFRNPVDRAYSHYWFNRNTKFKLQESLAFEEALESEEQRILEHPEFYEQGILSYAYFRTGLYAEQSHAFLKAFGRDNCLFLLFEDLFPENFPATARKIEDFLLVDPVKLEYTRKKESIRFRSKTLAALIRNSRMFRSAFARYLPIRARAKIKSTIIDFNNAPFKYPEMNPTTRNMLLDKYKPGILELERILDRSLSHWQ